MTELDHLKWGILVDINAFANVLRIYSHRVSALTVQLTLGRNPLILISAFLSSVIVSINAAMLGGDTRPREIVRMYAGNMHGFVQCNFSRPWFQLSTNLLFFKKKSFNKNYTCMLIISNTKTIQFWSYRKDFFVYFFNLRSLTFTNDLFSRCLWI